LSLAYKPLLSDKKNCSTCEPLFRARSATSFEDLRTIQGHCCPTYHEAATAFGLFRDVNEAEYALLDAMSEYCRPSQLRYLFAQLLVELPCPANELWTRFEQDLCGDYQMRHPPTESINLALEDIGHHLRSQRSSPTECGLPQPQQLLHYREVDQDLEYFRPYLETLQERVNNAYSRFNRDQHSIFDCILSPDSAEDNCFFINGRAGRGKTFLVTAMCDYPWRSRNRMCNWIHGVKCS
jgi:hypothetical protein